MKACPRLCTAAPTAWFMMGCTALSAYAADDKTIDDFLVNVDPSPLTAAQLIGMSPSAVVPIHEPKDFVAAIGGGTSSFIKDSFAISITPARSSLPGLRMAIGDYVPDENDRQKYLARLWGGTTLTYAQNRATYADTEYRQQGVAVQGLIYQEPGDDPVVAAHAALSREVYRPARTTGPGHIESWRRARLQVLQPRRRPLHACGGREEGPLRDRRVEQCT